jgi:hypothetical protein
MNSSGYQNAMVKSPNLSELPSHKLSPSKIQQYLEEMKKKKHDPITNFESKNPTIPTSPTSDSPKFKSN